MVFLEKKTRQRSRSTELAVEASLSSLPCTQEQDFAVRKDVEDQEAYQDTDSFLSPMVEESRSEEEKTNRPDIDIKTWAKTACTLKLIQRTILYVMLSSGLVWLLIHRTDSNQDVDQLASFSSHTNPKMMTPADCSQDSRCNLCLLQTSWTGFVMSDATECWQDKFLVDRSLALPMPMDDPVDAFKNQLFLFVGDATAQYVAYCFYLILQGKQLTAPQLDFLSTKHSTTSYLLVDKNITIAFQDDTLMSSTGLLLERELKHPNHIFFVHGRYDTLSEQRGRTVVEGLVEMTHQLAPHLSSIVYETAPPIDSSKVGVATLKGYDRKAQRDRNTFMRLMIKNQISNVAVLDGYWNFPVLDQKDGIHSATHAWYSAHRYVWFHLWTTYRDLKNVQQFIDSKRFGGTAYLLRNDASSPLAHTILASFQSVATLGASQCFVTTLCLICLNLWMLSCVLIRVFSSNFDHSLDLQYPLANNPKRKARQQYLEECQNLFGHATAFLAIMVLEMFVELNHSLPNDTRASSRFVYYMMVTALVYLSWSSRKAVEDKTITSAPTNQQRNDTLFQPNFHLVLNRQQTEEWKGWLQMAFILYHYMGFGSQDIYVFYPVRVYVACYVWLTGFGNYLFFISKNDFSFKRMAQMILRINLLISVHILVLPSTEYMRYYICPLHTIFFLMVWGVLRYDCKRNQDASFVLKKLGVCLGVLILFNEVLPDVWFDCLWSPLAPLLNNRGSLQDWRYRFQLDGYATWAGMVFAHALHTVRAQPQKYHLKHITQWYALLLVCAGVFVAWMLVNFSLKKATYIRMHRYTSCLVIVAFVLLRNCTPRLRKHYLQSLSYIGCQSLEMYILQLHLFLNHDGEGHLIWSLEYPLVSLLINFTILLFVSRIVLNATQTLNQWLLPTKPSWAWILAHRLLPTTCLLLFALITSNAIHQRTTATSTKN